MKRNLRILSSALCSGLLLSVSPAIFAEEVAAPEIATCEVCPDAEIVADDDVVIDDKTVVIDDETTTTDEEVVVDKENDSGGSDDGEVIGWNPDWVKRGEGGEEIYYMSAGGPSAEPSSNNTSATTPVEADKDAVVTTRTEKAPKANTVQRNTAKPNAVKSNGRVFLRK